MAGQKRKLLELVEAVRTDWRAAGEEVVGRDSPPSEFAEPPRAVDARALEEERARLLEEQRRRREAETLSEER